MPDRAVCLATGSQAPRLDSACRRALQRNMSGLVHPSFVELEQELLRQIGRRSARQEWQSGCVSLTAPFIARFWSDDEFRHPARSTGSQDRKQQET